MSVALVGGMDRLKRHYIDEAGRLGISLKVFNKAETLMSSKIKNVDAVVIFTNKISHRAKKEALGTAKDMKIPVLMYHSCGLCTLRECLNCLKGEMKCPRQLWKVSNHSKPGPNGSGGSGYRDFDSVGERHHRT